MKRVADGAGTSGTELRWVCRSGGGSRQRVTCLRLSGSVVANTALKVGRVRDGGAEFSGQGSAVGARDGAPLSCGRSTGWRGNCTCTSRGL